VQLLLESGALCERDTFQGERCLYNALNDRIRNLLLSYDYSKSTDPLQPFAAHITSLLTRDHPKSADITLNTASEAFNLHKFLLAARSPYFAKKLASDPDTTSWKASQNIATQSLEVAIRYLYLSEVTVDLGDDEIAQAILTGIDKLSRQLEIERLFETVIESSDRRLTRQRRTEELERGRQQLENWFRNHVLKYRIEVETNKADSVRWDRNNSIFADVLLRVDEDSDDAERYSDDGSTTNTPSTNSTDSLRLPNGIPIGPHISRSPSRTRKPRRSFLYPAHRAMLIRSDFFLTMFSSGFREAQETSHLHIIPLDISPRILEIVLLFLYCEKTDFGLDVAIDVLFAADMMFIEKLKLKAAMIISTLGNGASSVVEAENPRGETGGGGDIDDLIDIYDVVRAGWDTRVHRLEEFGARYIAYRLEHYIDEEEFAQLVRESAARIRARQETDTVELIDDIRYYLSERYRLRFEDTGFEEMTAGEDETQGDAADTKNIDVAVKQNSGLEMQDELVDSEGVLAAGGSVIRTLDGEIAGDEFAQDAMNYQILLGKIDTLLEKLKLDA
jgi:ankyrin repeat and BTB/POZ domain-containing protein 1